MVDDKHDDMTGMTGMTVSASGLFAPSSEPRLLVFSSDKPTAYPLPREGTVVVGRGDVDVKIDDPSLSRQHARIRLGGVIVVEDLGSRNGTHVGERRLGKGETAELLPGDAFGLGKLVCVIEAATAVRSPTRPSTSTKAPAKKKDARAKLQSLVALVAGSDISAVLCGETGVGKEVTARAIHEASPRKDKPFVGINCAALPEQLLESELFGYERGAFSGAVTAKPGLFEAAQGGTLFLDEVADMSLAVQAKLLRVVEDRHVMRLGSVKAKSIDVRFLAASHRSLDLEVTAGRFRQDLFFRLNGITLQIPPLRERADEIEKLALLFLTDASTRAKRPVPRLSAEALAALTGHAWPGNVRELKNTIERALMLSAGADEIDVEDLGITPSADTSVARVTSDGTVTSSVTTGGPTDERERILAALKEAAGNQTRAAELLGVSRRTLVNRIIEHGIARPRKK